uniref:Fe2OG dioxygenase domain-containing protein n=1 Tax=Vannella robusta TaxID=1487602 RepID=A0A7S4ICU2_9EUKA|mmetsp:Transcript_23905/g.30428  ORF Transcript_23905/g.30428 Transcript_23905/m.30428 type:complete len:322 (+) Transcript_23905:452-1417(+)
MFPPLIDLAPFVCDTETTKTKEEVALELRKACREVGFFQVRSPSVSQEDISRGFAAAMEFFDQPADVKESSSAFNSALFRGYQGTTSHSHSCSPNANHKQDLKESFTIGASGDVSPMHGQNNWPEACPKSIIEQIETYWNLIMEVSLQVSRCLALSLGLDEHFFTANMTNPVAQMVLLRYPPAPTDENQNPLRPGCGAHTDCGFLTLLVQDKDVDGLQIKDSEGNWIDAPQQEGCILCNLGDMAERWSNDYFKSTWHRVNNVSGRLRHSIPFFCNLDYNAEVDPSTSVCQGTLAEVVGSPKYEPICAGEYICQKLGIMHDN